VEDNWSEEWFHDHWVMLKVPVVLFNVLLLHCWMGDPHFYEWQCKCRLSMWWTLRPHFWLVGDKICFLNINVVGMWDCLLTTSVG
jgi:hypothetical protein